MIRAFVYFSTSRALYHRLAHDYKLPSIQTLTRLTSKVSKLSNPAFINRIFSFLSQNQKECIILFDEVYVKKMMLYHAGTLFGKASNNPSVLANAVLGIMIDCMYGGPTFLSSMIPVCKLKADFLNAQVNETIECVNAAGGTVTALTCDDNRTNQKLFNSFPTEIDKPWKTLNNCFLLFDYVHLIKSIRNNWVQTGKRKSAFQVIKFK